MADVLTKEQRSFNMSRIKSKNTKPELTLRSLMRKEGLWGYKIHPPLPGKPDILYSKYKLAIFVDGCFWHQCKKCFIMPRNNRNFWLEKLERNIRRDNEVNKKLHAIGYTVMRIREHEIKNNPDRSCARISSILLEREFKK